MSSGTCSVSRDIQIHAGTLADFEALKQFHYRAGRPGGVLRVWVACYEDGAARERGRVVGVLLESLPALHCMLRNHATAGRYLLSDRRLAAALLNREVRCLSRVVVHPVFRGLGLAVALVRHALAHAQSPFVEALAAMGRVHPFFAQAGMTAYDRPADAPTIRLVAALDRLALSPTALCHEPTTRAALAQASAEQRTFLTRELQRYLRQETPAADLPALLAQARARLLSQPIYYLWKRPR